MSPRRRFVVLDRDGTIIVEKQYLSDERQVELLPGAVDGLRTLADLGLGLLVVTNQSGVGRGYYSQQDAERVNGRMAELLDEYGVHIEGVYACYHAPWENCACRKPAPGLIERAAVEHEFLPSSCFVIGDKACDIGLGRAVEATTILVRTGYGEHEEQAGLSADNIADGLPEAASFIEERLERKAAEA